jgi:hypothetical protein
MHITYLAGFQSGSNRMRRLAPTKLSPHPPALLLSKNANCKHSTDSIKGARTTELLHGQRSNKQAVTEVQPLRCRIGQPKYSIGAITLSSIATIALISP